MGAPHLHPGTYGTVGIQHHTAKDGRTRYHARAWVVTSDGQTLRPSKAGDTPEEAEHRLREALHSIGLRDARNGAVSVRESVTEAKGQHDGEHVQAGDLDTVAEALRRQVRVMFGRDSWGTFPLYDAVYDVLVNAGHRAAADLVWDLAHSDGYDGEAAA